jgi:uncharacterized protein
MRARSGRLVLLLGGALLVGAFGCREDDPPRGGPGASVGGGGGDRGGGGEGGSAGSTGGESDERGLRIATYNTARFFDTTCDTHTCGADEYEPAVSAEAFENKLASVAASVRQLDADVVLVQEVETQAVLDQLAARLEGAYPTALLAETDGVASVDVGVLAKYPVLETRRHRQDPIPLATGGTTTFAREFFEVRLQHDDGPFTVFVAHFRSKRDDDPTRREAEDNAARAIVLAAHAERPDELLVWGGDLNDHPGSPPFDAIFADDLLLRVVAADLPYPADTTSQFEGTREAIDHLIMPTDTATRYIAGSARVFRGTKTVGFGSSDHAAVRASFRLR